MYNVYCGVIGNECVQFVAKENVKQYKNYVEE